MISLDGSRGEGGGQILRTALTLSMITGQPFRIEKIRAKRARPGLMRQHLTAVSAAAQISGARTLGAELGSTTLEFAPAALQGGSYDFAIGTAGSCTLVLQTILPALWYASSPSVVSVKGGTHNPAAPPADFLTQTWLPLVQRMGVDTGLELVRHGFYPAGGGQVRARVGNAPCARPIDVTDRGPLRMIRVESRVSGIPGVVARREIDRVAERLPGVEGRLCQLPDEQGPGNVLLAEVEHEHLTEVFVSFGEKGVTAETVADRLVKAVRRYLGSDAAVGEHLADQLVLPMALARGGVFTTTTVTPHLSTNLGVVEQFLPIRAMVTRESTSARIEIGPA